WRSEYLSTCRFKSSKGHQPEDLNLQVLRYSLLHRSPPFYSHPSIPIDASHRRLRVVTVRTPPPVVTVLHVAAGCGTFALRPPGNAASLLFPPKSFPSRSP